MFSPRSSLALVAVAASFAALGCGSEVTVVFNTCTTEQGSFEAGEQFPAGDGCNTCTCNEDGSVDCSELACGGCSGPPIVCPSPFDPSCTSEPVCDGSTWVCTDNCTIGCEGSPPIDCVAPPNCYYDGPVCVDGLLQCGNLICSEPPCDGPQPECPQPGDPNCASYPVCDEFGWSCVTECSTESCADLYPAGAALAEYQVMLFCGCTDGAECNAECAMDPICQDGGPPSDACSFCVQEAANNQASCVVNAVFSEVCQDDPECTAFVDCVLQGG